MAEGQLHLRINRFPIPTEAPDDYTDGAFCIKLSPFWFSTLQGYLEYLGDRRFFDEMTDEEWSQTLDWIGELATMTCECGITDVRIGDGGQIEVKNSAGDWVSANGDGGGATTVVNNQETLIDEVYPPDEPDEGISLEDRACAIATNLEAWLAEKFTDILQEVELTVDQIKASDAMLALFPPMYLIVDGVTDAIFEIYEVGVSIIETAFDTEQRETIQCAIYCWLLDNEATVTAANEGFLKVEIENILQFGLVSTYGGMLAAMVKGVLAHRAMLYQDAGSSVNCAVLCDNCGDECWSSSSGDKAFSEFDQRWIIVKGTYDAINDWIECDSNGDIELWYSLVAAASDETDSANVARSCPFWITGTISYDHIVTTNSFNERDVHALNIPSGSSGLENFAGQQNEYTDWVTRTINTDTETDRSLLYFRLSCDAGEIQRMRNIRFDLSVPPT